uniref:Uncharacterized protein n=1 Tax=Panagrolaimus sp. ES5 TaxID=591445 RepID=A0AC34G928_9BILA
MDPPGLEEEDTVTHAELYQAYVNFWNSLNNCLEDGDKIRPTNGTYPSFQEAKNLWKHMKKPRERKLFWIATGFTHPEFPDDEEQFRREEANGLIDDTNVTTGAVADDESSDDEIPDLNDENTPPVVNFAVNAAGDALNRLYGGAPVGMEDISSDEDAPQEHINANVAANNLVFPVNNGVGRPETPIALLHEPVVTGPVPFVISPVRSHINSLNLTTPPQPNMPTAPAPAAPSPVSAWVTTED